MTRINTNVSSLNAQKTLQRSNNQLQLALTRLSTGLRINTGKDDPAGLIASESLRSDIVSVQRAITNSERANQLIATADSALGQVSSLLNDIRGLVSEAANTGALSQEQLDANQLQLDSSLEAIDRISQITSFQGRKLLDGSFDFLTSGVNNNQVQDLRIDQANFGASTQIGISIDIVQQATRGQLSFAFNAISSDVVLEVGGKSGTEVFNFASGSSVSDIASAINLVSDATGVQAKVADGATKGQVTVSSVGVDNDIVVTANDAGFDAGNVRFNYVKGDATGTSVSFTKGTGGAPSQVNVALQTTAGVKATGLVNDAIAATLTDSTGQSDPNAEFLLTALEKGAAGNNIDLVVSTSDNGGNGVQVAVVENGGRTEIRVDLDTDAANGGVNSALTANDLIAAINGNNDANELVTAGLTSDSDGTGTLAAQGATALTGGADTANNALTITSRIAGEDFSDVSVHFVDGDKLQAAAFATTDIHADYQSDAVKARAAITLAGAGDDLLLTATEAGSQFNDVTIRFVAGNGLGDAANVNYDAEAKELVIEIDDSDGTTVGTLVQAINDEGTFTAAHDNSTEGAINNAQAVATATSVTVTGDTGKSGSDGKTIFFYIDAANTAAELLAELATPGDQAGRRVDALFDIQLANNNDGSGALSELALDKVVTGGVTAGQIVATASDVVTAINNSEAGDYITAALAAGNNGFGLVGEFQKFATYGTAEKDNGLQFLAQEDAPKIRFSASPGQALGVTNVGKVEDFASVTIQGTAANSTLKFTAKQAGADLDGYEIVFKDDQTLIDAQGDEKVLFDESKKRLTILIREGATTADDVINALANDEFASKFFKAENFGSSTGAGLVATADTDLNDSTLDLKTSGGLVDPGTLVVNLATDANGIVTTTANDLINYFETSGDPDIAEFGVSVSSLAGSDGTGLLSATTQDIDFSDLGVEYTDDNAKAKTFAVNGVNAQIEFEALQAGDAFDGVNVVFVNDESVTVGEETAAYDADTKTLTFHIDESQTTAQDIFNIFVSSDDNYDPDIAGIFTARLVGTGAGVVTLDDTATLTGGTVTDDEADGIALQGNADSSGEGLTFTSTTFGSDAFVQIKALSGTFELTNSTGALAERSAGTNVKARINGIEAVGKGLQASLNTASLDLQFSVGQDVQTGQRLTFNITGGGAQFQLGPDVVSNQQARLGIRAINSARLGGVSGKLYELRSGGSKSLGADPSAAASVVDEAITQVTSIRGRLGAFQKTTLESNIFTLNDTLENLTDAESSIRDADFAQESSRLTRAQILVQSGTSVLGIANSNPQNVLSLLR